MAAWIAGVLNASPRSKEVILSHPKSIKRVTVQVSSELMRTRNDLISHGKGRKNMEVKPETKKIAPSSP